MDRFNKSKCVNCPSGQNKVAVVERWLCVSLSNVFYILMYILTDNMKRIQKERKKRN